MWYVVSNNSFFYGHSKPTTMTAYPDIPQWVQQRILGFFNRARNIDMILDGTIQDAPSDGQGRTLGPTLAARILRTKHSLPRRRFSDLSQLDAIRGVGPNTLQDLVYSFGRHADETFRSAMYDSNTIYATNWPLEFFRTPIEDRAAFEAIARDPELLRSFVRDRVAAIAQDQALAAATRDAMLQEVEAAYLDFYSNSTPEAGYAIALWFYQFDADNWFSWERIQAQTLRYFEHHMAANIWQMDIYLFRGFVNRGLVRAGITQAALPVVVNWAEQTVTIWASALYD